MEGFRDGNMKKILKITLDYCDKKQVNHKTYK